VSALAILLALPSTSIAQWVRTVSAQNSGKDFQFPCIDAANP